MNCKTLFGVFSIADKSYMAIAMESHSGRRIEPSSPKGSQQPFALEMESDTSAVAQTTHCR